MVSTSPGRARGRTSNYDKRPVQPTGEPAAAVQGWEGIAARLAATGARVFLVDTQPAAFQGDIEALAARLAGDLVVDTRSLLLPPAAVDEMLAPGLTEDPVFGTLSQLSMAGFFDPGLLRAARDRVRDTDGRVVVHGPGAALLADDGVVVLAEVPRWETQLRQRARQVSNLGLDNRLEAPALQYKRSYFVDWRVWDRHKDGVRRRVSFHLDTTRQAEPVMVTAEGLLAALGAVSRRPFRVVPYFDPAPWGGQWMKEVCDLDRASPNWGWCFDCVPEENSLVIGFGNVEFETPATNLVQEFPRELLGTEVSERFGAEFPIRFDFLDTIDGGNLSLQVHPLAAYIREHFGMAYTQDESYYLLDAADGAGVYLGLRADVDRQEMEADLRRAQAGGFSFPADRYVNRFPARRHDHFLIPAGTIHCSGAGGMVLEISATPYIFTFKLWDWDRMGLDGRPRPIHLDHGLANIEWERDTTYARDHLVNRITPVGSGPGWAEERTGLHEAEFIETRRHWFTGPVPHDSLGGVNVLNLVQGEEAVVVSPDGAFDPFPVHFAETFIVPAAVGPYVVQPVAEPTDRLATIKAFVRPGYSPKPGHEGA